MRGCTQPDPRVWNFTSAGNWEVAEEPLHRFWESYTPVHQDINRAWLGDAANDRTDEQLAVEEAASRDRGAGLGMSFAAQMADFAGGEQVGLLACAHGGTSLDQWNPDLAPEQGTHCLYGAMLDRIRRAGGQLQGLLWYQGESDCGPGAAETYETRMTKWIARVREDVGMPDLPVILVQLGCVVWAPRCAPDVGGPWDIVRDALVAVAEKVPHVAVVGAVDLALTDLIHISTPGLIRLGRRMATSAVKMAQGAPYCSAPRVVAVEAAQGRWGMGFLRLKCEGVTGGWLPRERMGGFGIYDAKGDLHEKIGLIEASADLDDPTSISLMLNLPVDEPVLVGYGRGVNPYCNVVDEADMGLLAFAKPFGG